MTGPTPGPRDEFGKDMDCEKFDSVIIDELYGELDELTSAAAKRHVAGCARCAARLEGLKATRRVAAASLVSGRRGLERGGSSPPQRRPASFGPPQPRPRWAHAVSLAGSWAMRPQTAMAAVFLVMIGTSVLLLRGKSARAPLGDGVTVTEQGTPAPAAAAPSLMRNPSEPAPLGAFAQAPAPATEERPQPTLQRSAKGAVPRRPAAPPTLSRSTRSDDAPDERFHAALRSYRAGRFDDAARAFESLPSSDPNAPDLWAARSVRDGKGAAPRSALRQGGGTPPANVGGLGRSPRGALCYRALGDLGRGHG